MFFGDWLRRREMLSPNKVALFDAVNDNRPITFQKWNRQIQAPQISRVCGRFA
jgi:hypothetical protein